MVLGDVLPTITAPCYALTDDGSRAGGGPRSCSCSCSRFRPKLAAQLSHTTTALPCGRAGTCFSKTCGSADDTEGDCRPWFRPARSRLSSGYSVSSSFLILHTSHPIPHTALLPPNPLTLASVDLFACGKLCFSLYHRPLPRRAAIARLSTLFSSLLPLGFSSPAIASRSHLSPPHNAPDRRMLISWGLKALFLGSAVAATALDRHGVPTRSSQVLISQQLREGPEQRPSVEAAALENVSLALQGGNEATLPEMRGIQSPRNAEPEYNTTPDSHINRCSVRDTDGNCPDGTTCCSNAMVANRRRQDGNA